MRICFVSTEVAGFRGGGIGTYVVEAGHALSAHGHEVWLVTRDPGRRRREELRRHPAFAQVRFADDLGRRDPDRFRFGIAGHVQRFAALAHETLLVADVAFDYVEFADYGGEGYVALLEQKLFDCYGDTVLGLMLHSPSYEIAAYNRQLHLMPPTLREQCALEDEAIRSAEHLVCPSQRLLEMVGERLRLPTGHGELVRYPMRLGPPPPPPAPGRKLADLRFAYFGRIELRKGVDVLIEAFRRLPHLRLELIGDDRDGSPWGTSNIAWLSKDLPPNITFRPSLPRERLLAELADIDVCLFPSAWENWPNVCIEAMAAARVVVGGRNGGMAEMIEHGSSGFLVDSDPLDIARVVAEDLAAALPHLDRIGHAAAARIRELSDPVAYAERVTALVARSRSRRKLRPEPPSTSDRLVSIVVPYYDEDEAVLGEAIDSACGQSHRKLEIVLVEDGSPRPDGKSIVERVAARDARIRTLHKPNGGLASARNFALEQVEGEVVLCLDADNVLRTDYVRTGLEVLTRFPDVMAVVGQYQVFYEGTRKPPVIVDPLPWERALALFRNESGDAGAMFRTAVFREHGLRYDPLLESYSDWALWMDMATQGLRVQCIPRTLYDYRYHGRSMTSRTAWTRHLALVGLLIERHLPPADLVEERALLTTLAQGWGVGAILAAWGGRREYYERPSEVARLMQGHALHYRAAEAVAWLAGRVPGLLPVVNAVLRTAFGMHGRYKDWRRGQ